MWGAIWSAWATTWRTSTSTPSSGSPASGYNLRCFLALTPPPALKRALAELGRSLYQHFPPHTLRLVPEAQRHLTLLFLGNVNSSSLPDLISRLEVAGATHQPFSLSVKGLGVFPNPRRARVLWCGVAGDLAALTALNQEFCRALEHEASRSFHLTLGRFKTPPPQEILLELLNRHAGFVLPAWQVSEVELFASELTAKGAQHTPLARIFVGQLS